MDNVSREWLIDIRRLAYKSSNDSGYNAQTVCWIIEGMLGRILEQHGDRIVLKTKRLLERIYDKSREDGDFHEQCQEIDDMITTALEETAHGQNA